MSRKSNAWRLLPVVATSLALLAAGAWLGSNLGAQEQGKDEKAKEFFNAEAAKKKNPEEMTKESIEAGEKLYQQHCASCHGKTGKGDGGLALGGGEASNFTDDVWDYGSTDGEIFEIIWEGVPGSADMLDYKKTITEKQTWQLVNFLRSLGPKKK